MSKQQQTQERIERCRVMLADGWSKGAVKAEIRKRFGDLSARTIENYITAAKRLILEASELSERELRANSLAFYQVLRVHPQASIIAKTKING